jgi:hypothetical protein
MQRRMINVDDNKGRWLILGLFSDLFQLHVLYYSVEWDAEIIVIGE